MAPIDNLPQELIDKIIDRMVESMIQNNEPLLSSLSNCPLVCRSFLFQPQAYLYSRVFFGANEKQNEIQHLTTRLITLFDILRGNLRLSKNIIHLHISISGTCKDWIVDNPVFLQILQILRDSGTFKTFVINGQTSSPKFPAGPLVIRKLFCPFIAPFITALELAHVKNVPISVIETCESLKALVLVSVTINPSYSSKSRRRPQLRRLEHRSSGAAVMYLLNTRKALTQPAIDTTRLRAVTVQTYSKNELRDTQSLIDAASGSLERLHLQQMNPGFGSFMDLVNLGQCKRLRSLKMDVVLNDIDDSYLDGITSVLRSVTTDASNFNLEISVEAGMTFFIPFNRCCDVDWVSFASQISRLSTGKHFRLHLILAYIFEDRNRTSPYRKAKVKARFMEECQHKFDNLINKKIGSILKNKNDIFLDVELKLFPGSEYEMSYCIDLDS
ncbi:hypothetical protein CVT25_005633 [Psilocybe cyanescens]|uniref:F-box domain-containing protein n=1 Tax=Psilocybe cyanescens TaxID=93625 RepID=A0A409X6F6_PSICY|nr:hypothetical protein CVT25_005633 [Psilocybe cyanescens]